MILRDTTIKSINNESVKNRYGSEKPPENSTDFLITIDIITKID